MNAVHSTDNAPFPFGKPNSALFYNARTALWQGLKTVRLNPGDRILAPAYCCGSEIDVLLKAGAALDFYRLQPDLSPDPAHLDRLCTDRTRALFIIHYYGFAQPMESILGFAREHNLLLIEDCAHGLYSSCDDGIPIGRIGDLAIFSLTKMLPVPNGGVLVAKDVEGQQLHSHPICRPRIRKTMGGIKRSLANSAAYRSSTLGGRLVQRMKRPLLPQPKPAARRDASHDPASGDEGPEMSLSFSMATANWGASAISEYLVARVDHARVLSRRRSNYLILDERLTDGRHVRRLFPRLPRACCPMFFPIQVSDAWHLYEFLMRRGIGSIPYWAKVHPALPIDDFPFERNLKRHVLVLPVHQDLGPEDMAIIVQTLEEWDEQASGSTGALGCVTVR